ncbi:hypothetical protein MFLAVUS_003193 [Mucor flavus]|uniref:protein disulfide-isomerase n=1 Tax=Mucor flavus TaxID=439312 RepID=A0ABP9YSG1_9FUNG
MVKKTVLWSAITAVFTSAVYASHVLSLTDTQEFDEAIESNQLMLINFYSNPCQDCASLSPEFEKAAEILKADNITLAEIDCSVNSDVCSRYTLLGYPTIQIFRQGRVSDLYPHERTSERIITFMKRHLVPGLSLLQTQQDLESFKKDESILAVAYLDPSDDHHIGQWKDLSGRLIDDYAFGYVTDKDFAAAEGITEFPSYVVYKHFDELKNTQSGHHSSHTLDDFIKLNAVPLLETIRPDTFMDYVDANRPLVYLFSNSDEMQRDLHNVFFPLAIKYKGKFAFAHIDANEYVSQADFLALRPNQWPAMAVHNFNTGARFPFDQTKDLKDVQAIESFLNDVEQNKLEPALKSQSFGGEEDVVKVVVGNDFEKIVLDKSKDVFVEIYAPWCGHCQAMAPTWKQLGQFMEDYEGEKHGIVVAKMDGTVNDVPLSAGFQVTGYPTIKLFKADTNTIVDYNGKRTLHDFVQFLKQESSRQTFDIDLSRIHDEL